MRPMKHEYGYYFPDDETHFQAYVARGDYQGLQREMALGICRALQRPMNVALDIGAHVGLWAKPLSAHFKKIICFEPRPQNVECLRKNLQGCNAEIYPFGLSDAAGTKPFHMPSDVHNSGAGSFDAFADRPASATMAELRTLDSFHFPEINFIKMDVQGWEIAAIRGGAQTIKRTMPIVVCENHPERWQLMQAFFELGYERLLRVVKEDIYVPVQFLTDDTRPAIVRYFNERKDFFDWLASQQ